MDIITSLADKFVFEPYIYSSLEWQASSWRLYTSVWIITLIAGVLMYLIFASLSYYFVFDHQLMKNPLFLQGQVHNEMDYALKSIFIMSFLTAAMFYFEVKGYSLLHDTYPTFSDGSYGFWHELVKTLVVLALFIFLTDMMIYFNHRCFHWPILYKYMHKGHHTWKITSPFSSHAAHPVEGLIQSAPYHLFAFIVPMNKWLYLLMFLFVNIWAVSIHDGNCKVPPSLQWLISGAAHHTDHHLTYLHNYGQFFTFWDRLCGSYKVPDIYKSTTE